MNREQQYFLDLCVQMNALAREMTECTHIRRVLTARELGEPCLGPIDPIESIKTIAKATSEAYVGALSRNTDLATPCGVDNPLTRYVTNYGV